MSKFKPGDRVLDAGCGPGSDTIHIARVTGKIGLVIGIDYDEALINKANERAKKVKVSNIARHIWANAEAIPFKSNSFDVCRSERLLQHVSDIEGTIEELIRVIKIGGRIVVADTDWASLSIDTSELSLERRVVRFISDMFHNGYSGRQLYRILKENKMQDVAVRIHPVVWTNYYTFRDTSFSLLDFENRILKSRILSNNELQIFLNSLDEAQKRGVFFACGNIVIATGVKAR
jgi:ubiquinone/menaquinone biosynthesis C-methylase UbiE